MSEFEIVEITGREPGKLWEQLWHIDQNCFSPAIAYSGLEIRAYLNHPRGAHWMARLPSNEIAGFLLSAQVRDRGHIITVDVLAEHRGTGMGSALMRTAEDHFCRCGARDLRLEVAVTNDVALRFYQRLGFAVTRTLPGYYAGELDGLRMEKSLAPML